MVNKDGKKDNGDNSDSSLSISDREKAFKSKVLNIFWPDYAGSDIISFDAEIYIDILR
jgi:hypothetical protein